MSRKGSVLKYQGIWFLRKVKRKLFKCPIKFDFYAQKDLMELQAANDLIAQWISEQKPFMAARFGSQELEAT